MRKHSFLAALFFLALALPARAELTVAGVKFADDSVSGDKPLVLNGAGLRKKAFFKVYAIGLYLPAKAGAAEAAIGGSGPKRVRIVMMRDVDADTFAEALIESVHDNSGDAEKSALAQRLEAFKATLLTLKEAKEGDEIVLDFATDGSTQLMVGGAAKGAPVAGADFQQALLKIWLGAHPVQDDLKQALLGKGS